MQKAVLEFHHPRAEVIERALKPESAESKSKMLVRISKDGDKLTLDIESQDINGLRAAINSYLRWIDMTVRITERIGE